MEERNITAEQCRMFYLDGEKMKTNTWLCVFRLPLSRENATKLALLAEVMKEGTKALPSNLHLNRRAEELYVKIYDKKTKDTSKVSFVFFFARIFFAALGKNRSKRKKR